MSDQQDARRCRWEGCEAEPTNHAVYTRGPAQIRPADSARVSIVHAAEHANLCAPHASELRERHPGAVITGLGRCASDSAGDEYPDGRQRELKEAA